MGERGRRARSLAIRGTAGVLASTSLLAVLALPVAAQAPGEQWHNGEAAATADTFLVNIKQGNANIGITYGRSMAGYRDITGNAEARAIDLGVLPTLMGGEQCDGSAPILNPATLPPNTRVDSLVADSNTSRRVEAFNPGFGAEGPGGSAGFQDAVATKMPSSTALTETPPTDLFMLAVEGATTRTYTALEGKVRTAHAVVTADRLRVFGGLFTFDEPRWEATAKSGAETTARGNFTFESATVLGMPRPYAQVMTEFAEFEQWLEQLLAPLGVQLNLPRVEAADGRVKVTPMEFLVTDMPWGAQVVAPFLGQLQPLKEALTQQLLEEDCKNETALLLLDVVLGILAGSGSIEITAGGVEAWTADTDFSSPPLEPMPTDSELVPAPEPVVATEVLPDTSFSTDLGFDDLGFDDLGFDDDFSDLGIDTTADLGIDTTTTDTTIADDTEEIAAAPASAGTRFEDSTAGRAAIAVGVAGLLGAIGLSFGERLMSRRTSRRIP